MLICGWIVATIFGVAFVVYTNACAYSNGVTDGFGFAREPSNPGYARAGRWLVTHMSYRWHELKQPKYAKVVQD